MYLGYFYRYIYHTIKLDFDTPPPIQGMRD